MKQVIEHFRLSASMSGAGSSISIDEMISPASGHDASVRRRVLVSAYAVSPYYGSEPGVGWHICSRLAKWHDVTVLCSPGIPGRDDSLFRNEIADYFSKNPAIPGLNIRFVEPPLLSRWFQKEDGISRRTVYYTGYKAWQRAAFREARSLHEQESFDLAHQLNITGYREPGYLWSLPIPFVWGPIGGASNIPDAFMGLMGWKERAFYRFRNAMNEMQKRTSFRCRKAARAARHIWAIGEETRQMVQERWNCSAENMIESGASPRASATVRSYDGTRGLRVVWSGQHIGRKALPILLHAMASAETPTNVELVVLGAGPETSNWKALCTHLGLDQRVRWTGMIPYEQALDEMSSADVLGFTSVQEGTPHVVLEALSLGLPVICHEACGMGAAVTTECGIKLPMRSPDLSIKGFIAALSRLSASPAEVATLSRGALERANELSWDGKARHIAQAYEHVWSEIGADATAVK